MANSHIPNGRAAATGHSLEMLQNIETLQMRLCAATVENRRLREALRRVVREARRQHRAYKNMVTAMLGLGHAAGPWHPASEEPPIGRHLTFVDDSQGGETYLAGYWPDDTADWYNPQTFCPLSEYGYTVLMWAEIREPEERT